MDIVSAVPEIHFFEEVYDFGEIEPIDFAERKKIAKRLLDNVRRREPVRARNGILVKDIEEQITHYIQSDGDMTCIDIYIRFASLLNFGKTPVDPTPRNAYFMRKIHKRIPEAKFIYMVRDPRDCILSQSVKWKKYYRSKKYFEALRLYVNYHPVLMATFWKNSFKELRESQKEDAIHNHVLVLRYEDVTAAPYDTARKIATFLGRDLKPAIDLEYVNSNNSYKWKRDLSKSKMYLIEKNLTATLKKMGYEVNQFSFYDKLVSNLIRFLYSFKYPFILLLNVNRTRNLWGSFKLRVLGR